MNARGRPGSIEGHIERMVELYRQALEERSRPVDLPGRKCAPVILYTFLGFEVKAGRQRLTCPDMATARYLQLFCELGLPRVEVPYDPTRTSALVPELESSLSGIKELLLREGLDRRRHQLKLRQIYGRIRAALLASG